MWWTTRSEKRFTVFPARAADWGPRGAGRVFMLGTWHSLHPTCSKNCAPRAALALSTAGWGASRNRVKSENIIQSAITSSVSLNLASSTRVTSLGSAPRLHVSSSVLEMGNSSLVTPISTL